ncbi:unnamed protein product [Tuwongella immobilis]|uniref:Uncharacterized protein n=1 Tax=Tuwongella immobilis TaxID=692036 RepID=A0A6C2YUC0_9BACT|nr:unnamed protein product [Tuwongella immobilis]VTS07796.1 unnamed protein product [Tuwongella immobilis]
MNADGFNSATDFCLWKSRTTSCCTGSSRGRFNSATDFCLWK